MLIDGKHQRTIWVADDGRIGADHRPDAAAARAGVVVDLTDLEAAAAAIETMQVRGAPLIGATAAYGMCLALPADASDDGARATPMPG